MIINIGTNQSQGDNINTYQLYHLSILKLVSISIMNTIQYNFEFNIIHIENNIEYNVNNIECKINTINTHHL